MLCSVEFLRKNNLGRCTFLIMDKVAQARDVVDTPENVPRLFDLIKPKDPKFRNGNSEIMWHIQLFYCSLLQCHPRHARRY